MVNPCCSRPLQTGVKIVAIINLVYTLGLIVVEVVMVFKNGLQGVVSLNPEFAEGRRDENGLVESSNRTELVTSAIGSGDSKATLIFSMPALDFAISTGWILSWIIDIGFSILLYRAAVTKSIVKCLIWFYFRSAILVFRIIFLIIYIIAGLSVLSKIPVIILFAIRIYSLWVVNSYVSELKEERRAAEEGGVVVYSDSKDGIENPSFT